MLNEVYILRVIREEISGYEFRFGVMPNVLILGLEILNIITAYNTKELIHNTDKPSTLYGIPISRNYADPLACEVGFTKKIDLGV